MSSEKRKTSVGTWFGVVALAILFGKFLANESVRGDAAVATTSANTSAIDLPVMLDSQTMVTSIEEGQGFTVYHLKMVNFQSSSLDSSFIARAQNAIAQRNCIDSDIVWTYENGHSHQYIVHGSDDKKAGSFIVSKDLCRQRGYGQSTAMDLPQADYVPIRRDKAAERCNAQYQEAIASVPQGTSLGNFSKADEIAKQQLNRCLSR